MCIRIIKDQIFSYKNNQRIFIDVIYGKTTAHMDLKNKKENPSLI
jgi:hypothetical protein